MMRRLYSIIALVLALALALPSPALANDMSPSGKDWQVTFNGTKMTSNFDDKDIDDLIKNLQPGDEFTVKVKVKHTYSKKTDWYMRNEVIKSLEDNSQTAEGGSYSYKLSYTNNKGKSKVFYDSKTVGGEATDVNEALEGLNEATEGLEDYFYLDTLGKGQGGTVTLYVALDGESQGNDYQDTMARIKLDFATEKDKPVTKKKKVVKTKKKGSTAKTGDENNMMLYFILAGVSGLALLGLGGYSMKVRKKEEEEG